MDATIAGGLDSLDTAYGLADFGGSSGWSGRVWTRDVIALAPSIALGGNLSVLQQRDVSGNLVWEIYIDGSSRQISLWSPAGGLGASAINQSTGVAMDGQSHTVEVSALPMTPSWSGSTVRTRSPPSGSQGRLPEISVSSASGSTTTTRDLERIDLDQSQRCGSQHPRLAGQSCLDSRRDCDPVASGLPASFQVVQW